jgi:hypothetical protein
MNEPAARPPSDAGIGSPRRAASLRIHARSLSMATALFDEPLAASEQCYLCHGQPVPILEWYRSSTTVSPREATKLRACWRAFLRHDGDARRTVDEPSYLTTSPLRSSVALSIRRLSPSLACCLKASGILRATGGVARAVRMSPGAGERLSQGRRHGFPQWKNPEFLESDAHRGRPNSRMP